MRKQNQSELAKGEARVRERLGLKTASSAVSLTDEFDLCKHSTGSLCVVVLFVKMPQR